MRFKLGAGSWGLLLAAVAIPASGQAPATSVTLFNSGRVLVRRTLPVVLPSGSSTQSLQLGLFDPASLTSLDPGVTVAGIRFDPSWSEDALLRRSVGKAFRFQRLPNSFQSATLVALDPERWKWEDGTISFGRPGQLQWRAEDVPTAAVTDVTLKSDRARQSVKVMYATSGGSWNASYRIFLGAQGRVEGVASLNGGTLDMPDVEVQLLAGDIGRPVQAPAPMYAAKAMSATNAFEDAVGTEAVGDAHLYSLPSRLSFLPGVQFTVPLFETTAATGERRLTVGGGLPYYGGFQQQPDESPVPVEVAYRFERKAGTPFGELVLPAGAVSLFSADNAGRMQLIGQGSIGHTPAGKELLVPTGTAFDVTAKRVQSDYNISRVPGAGNAPAQTIVLASYRVTLQNAKDSAVVVEVREDRGGEWSIVSSSIPAEKRSSTRSVFTVPVPAKGTTVLTYRVRVVW
ncbi:MAG: hypothetical protein ABUL71_00240 [Gemmatimonadota bacterium]